MKLRKLIRHFVKIYGRRNNVFLQGFLLRIDFLSLAAKDLNTLIRKSKGIFDSRKFGIALSRIVARIFCIIQYFIRLPFLQNMRNKYGREVCTYCDEVTCICDEDHPQFRNVGHFIPGTLTWALKDWQVHLNSVYGKKNKQDSIEAHLNRLSDEIDELREIALEMPNTKLELYGLERKISTELADCLARLFAIANYYDIDVETHLLNRYGDGCPTCMKEYTDSRRKTCRCGQFEMKLLDWDKI